MIKKVLLTLVMLFTFGTSVVNAEEDTAVIEDRISELAETKSDSKSAINAKVDELSEDELKAIIANVDELTEQTEEDLAIKEASMNKLEEMEEAEVSLLLIGIGVVGIVLVFSSWIMELLG